MLQPLVLRSGRGPLRRVWAAVHWTAIAVVRLWVASPAVVRGIYLKGGFGFGKPIYGLSDVDMIVVLAGDAAHPGVEYDAAQRRWRRLCGLFPPLAKLFQLWIYEEAELRELEADTYLTFGLRHTAGGVGARSAFLGSHAPRDDMRLLDHPGLQGVGRDWRGVRSSPPPPGRYAVPLRSTVLAWLELRYVWAHAFATASDPNLPSAAYTCQKLVAEPARIWLWLRHGEQLFEREAVLMRSLALVPGEEDTLSAAIELGRRLTRRPPPPLAEVLPFLVRMSSRIAEHLAEATAGAGATEVELVWDRDQELLLDAAERERIAALATPSRPRLLPLVDWRGCAIPALIDEAFGIVPGDPSEPGRLAQIARSSSTGPLAMLTARNLLVGPVAAIGERGRLRLVQCRTSDPVSHALARGATRASFPNIGGWCVRDWAARAVAEQRAHLELGEQTRLPPWVDAPLDRGVTALSAMFGAARAALFAESVASGQPELPLTAAAVAAALGERYADARMVAECAYDALAAARLHRRGVDPRITSALRGVVDALPSYRPGIAPSPPAMPQPFPRSPRPS